MKKEEEREAARAERERLREERKVEHGTRCRARTAGEGASPSRDGDREGAGEWLDRPGLERKVADVDSAIAQNDYRAANIRAGYVYVISNRGAFGDHVVKIGLTRRLEPLDRINELGDASVPFRFDVHAIYFSEDAVKLENELHEHFSARRVNWANDRKEFFFASPADVRRCFEKVGNLLEFVEHCESTEYSRACITGRKSAGNLGQPSRNGLSVIQSERARFGERGNHSPARAEPTALMSNESRACRTRAR